MLIFYSADSLTGPVTQVVILDAQRSDDRFGTREIENIATPAQLKGRTILPAKVFSCEYSATYTHGAGAIGDTWKTKFFAQVHNPPAELIAATMPKNLASAVTPAEIAQTLVQRIMGRERTLTYSKMCVRGVAGIVTRDFVAYTAEHTPNSGNAGSILTIQGGGFFDGVLKNKIAFRLDKTKTLLEQLKEAVGDRFTITFVTVPEDRKPTASNFIPASPLNRIIGQICRDNNMTFDIGAAELFFYDTTAAGAPKKTGDFEGSFLGRDGMIVYNFALSNFVQAQFHSEVFDVALFNSFVITNDAGYAFFAGLNEFNAKPPKKRNFFLAAISAEPVKKYNFFILAYTLKDSREATHLQITSTNNWVLGEMRVSALLESEVYLDALKNKTRNAAKDTAPA